ncbi:MAG: hypothetical protein H3C49_01380 [Alphaproteobacteria bacterium]|nr:hypothetical protein [Alphaproteobacteria bacterium]
MFSQFVSSIRPMVSPDAAPASRRQHLRRHDAAVKVVVAGRPLTVRDWSEEGLRFDAPHDDNSAGIYFDAHPLPSMKAGDVVTIMMTFQVMGEAIRVPADIRILRRDGRGIVGRFVALSGAAHRQFLRAKDLLNAEAFLVSQQPAAFNA